MPKPLYIAIKHGHYDACKLLLEYGARDEWDEALLYAAEYGHTKICELLLDSGHDPMSNYWCDYEGGTALHMAAKGGYIDTCKLLIERGADVNFTDSSFATPLHAAASSKSPLRVEVCKLLLDHGADMYEYGSGFDYRGNPGYILPIEVAAENGHTDVCKVFIDAGMNLSNNNEVALFAMGCKHYETCRFLLMRGASTQGLIDNDYNLDYLNTIVPNTSGSTPLIQAIVGGHYDACAMLLLDYNADKYKDRPLHTAVRYDRVDICELLLDAGVNINHTDDVYGTVLTHAVLSGTDIETCRFLLSKGADPNKSVDYLDSPLHGAIERNNLELCQLLIDHGVDTEARNECGETPLCNALGKSHTNIAKLLITRGVNTDIYEIGCEGWSSGTEGMLTAATDIISIYAELRNHKNEHH